MDQTNNIFCYYCGKKTETIYKEFRRPINGRMLLIHNVPLFFCRGCREIFYPDFVINVFNNIPKLELNSNKYKFEFIYNLIINP